MDRASNRPAVGDKKSKKNTRVEDEERRSLANHYSEGFSGLRGQNGGLTKKGNAGRRGKRFV